MRTCSVSVDLDEVVLYHGIHGLAIDTACHAVYDVALRRIREFAVRRGLPLTFFVVARDLERPRNADLLRQLVCDGHEIGNHSLDHRYDLTLCTLNEQRRQVREANERIRSQLGVTPVGFRAPGYTMSDRLLAILGEAGLSYDSSVFPCPSYYVAKGAALLGMKARRRRSTSVLGSPNTVRAPTVPYRAGAHFWKVGQSGMLELPIQVVGAPRIPFIGTTLTLLGPIGARLLTQRLVGVPFVNLELHGMDFLEAADVPKQLSSVQPDLTVPFERKLASLTAALDTLTSNGYSCVRLDVAAEELAGVR